MNEPLPKIIPQLPSRSASTLVSRNLTVCGHRTSIRLEPAMWVALREICARERRTLSALATAIGRGRSESSLTAAVRVFVLGYYRAAATEEGHARAGHGGLTPQYRTEDRAA